MNEAKQHDLSRVTKSYKTADVCVVGGWLGLSVQNKNKLDSVTRTGGRIIGTQTKTISQLSEQYTLNLALRILDDPSHPLFPEYILLPFGHGFLVPRTTSKSSITSLIPRSRQLLTMTGSDTWNLMKLKFKIKSEIKSNITVCSLKGLHMPTSLQQTGLHPLT